MNTWRVFLAFLLCITSVLALPSPVPVRSSVSEETRDVQTSFLLPCERCGPSHSGSALLFNVTIGPSDTPCGATDITINGVALNPAGEEPRDVSQFPETGITTVSSFSHDVGIQWNRSCAWDPRHPKSVLRDDVQLLAVETKSVDGIPSTQGPSFYISVRTFGRAEIFEIQHTSAGKIKLGQEPSDTNDLETASSFPINNPAAVQISAKTERLRHQIATVDRLRQELSVIQNRIQAEEESLFNRIDGRLTLLPVTKASHVSACGHLGVAFSALRRHGENLLSYLKPASQHQSSLSDITTSAAKSSSLLDTNMFQTSPDCSSSLSVPRPAHCNDGRSSDLPYSNEKQSLPVPVTSSSSSDFKEGRGLLANILKFILVVTGLAYLFSLLRRLCISLRRPNDRDRYEEQCRQRAQRRSAQQQRLRKWWNGHHRQDRPSGGDEKSNLIIQQESVLEEAMQDEIRQLAIQEEFRRMRRTQDMADELLRAEEGRHHDAGHSWFRQGHQPALPPYSHNPNNPFQNHSQTTQGLGFISIPTHRPAPINIYSYPTGSSHNSTRDYPATPLSRTSSLPDYRSEAAFSDPPSYHTYDTDRDAFTDTDGEDDGNSYYAGSIASPRMRSTSIGTCSWTPAHTIPDCSPRPSFVVERSFV